MYMHIVGAEVLYTRSHSSTSMEAVVGVCCAVVVLIWGWRVLNWVWLKPKRLEKRLRQQGLKGNPYRLLYGDLKEMAAMSKEAKSKPIALSEHITPRALPLEHKCIQNFGKKSFVWLGATPMVHIMEPELINYVMTKNYEFQRPKENNALSRLLATGLLDVECDEWAKHRKIVNPAFRLERLKDMLPAFHRSCNEMMRKWEEKASGEGGCEMDVWPDLQTMTADVISRTAFGSNYEEGRQIFELLRELAELVTQLLQSAYIPGSRFLPTKRNRRIKEISREVEGVLKVIIDKGVKAIEDGKGNKGELLSLLLESNLNEIKIQGNKNLGLSIEEVIGECKFFYFAGQETTSAWLVWTMVLLSRYPTWQTRAREEVRQVFGPSSAAIDYDGLSQLKIVNMILHEALRLYPPVVALNRETVEETKVGELSLPAGVRLSLPTIMLHYDPQIWGEDATEFKPERFSEGVSKATKGQVCFVPFGWGPRICIGQNFAMLEAKMALAMILQRFSFQLSPSYIHAPHTVITLQPQHGAHLILHKV